MDKERRRLIESKFYDYERLSAHAAEKLADAAYKGMTAKYDAVRVTGGVGGSKVERAFLALGEDSYRDYLWARVVENTMIHFRHEVEYEVIVMRYIHKKSDTQSYLFCNLPRRTYYRLIDNILLTAEDWAREFGLL